MTASIFRPGQRWISASEPELGLGVVESVAGRTVAIRFASAEQTRQYVRDNAPLRRAAFRAGDTIRTADGVEATVEAVVDEEGLLVYQTGGVQVSEAALHPSLSFSSPPQRLFAGFFDRPDVFDLRIAALQHQHRRRQSAVRGFLGGRIDLLPHQIGIAAEVTSRLLPRVLLADEVGLGKTIEACLIVHRLLLSGRAQRVLVLVQESLVHQWFLELLRRFSLWFHIFDEARCEAIQEGDPGANPFLEHQLALCDVQLLAQRPTRLQQALDAGWDVLVVDEAHHLAWTPKASSAEYRAVDAIGQRTPGLLLLTATPEQLGMAGHFARLRLLDANRFHDLDEFIRESETYHAVAEDAEALHRRIAAGERDQQATLDALIDRHGTSRVIFRNTRASVSGFPLRRVHLHALSIEGDDSTRRKALAREWTADTGAAAGLDTRPTFTDDPRTVWLLTLLRELAPDKVLLICRTDKKALALETAVRQHIQQLKVASFHEGLTLVQRDRAAAWFAEPDGARLLLCSEIGSEGRNFQFAHHLVLFDLPLDPALLEQRIGRLDRIGQRHDVEVHVPFIADSHQEVLARWYHDGLNAFAHNVAGGRELFERFERRLRQYADNARKTLRDGRAEFESFIADVQRARAEVARTLERGQDRLLEWNSFRPAAAARAIDEIRAADADRALDTFMLGVFNLYMIEVDELAPRTYRLGSAGVLVDDFPGLSADQVSVTCDRQRALVREDLQFLTWDHPLVSGALDLLFGSDHGNCAYGRWIDPGATEIYLEAVYVLECVAPPRVHADRFLPPTPIRTVVDRRGRDVTNTISTADLAGQLTKGDEGRGVMATETLREKTLPQMLTRTRDLAEQGARSIVERAREGMNAALEQETVRLRALQRVNRSVREEEIAALVEQQRLLDQHVSAARLRLDALRVIHRGPRAS